MTVRGDRWRLQDKEGLSPRRLARASFVIVASPDPWLLKMCVAYCKPQKEILILTNG